MSKPIILCTLACFFWGFIFVAPLFLEDFSSIDLVLGRFLFYGFLSLILMLFNLYFEKKNNFLSFWKEASLCALVMNFCYYLSLNLGMKLSSPSIIALIVGIAPITIAIFSSNEKGLRPARLLLKPSIGIFIGIAIVNIPELVVQMSNLTLWQYLQGILYGLFSLALWTWYVIYNANFLQKHPEVSPRHWTALIGVATFGFASAGSLIRWYTSNEIPQGVSLPFILVSLFLGVICSGLAFTLWNIASTRLPPTLTGQLAVLETVFGIIFIYIVRQEFPAGWEIVGIGLILGSIWKGLHAFSRQEKASSRIT